MRARLLAAAIALLALCWLEIPQAQAYRGFSGGYRGFYGGGGYRGFYGGGYGGGWYRPWWGYGGFYRPWGGYRPYFYSPNYVASYSPYYYGNYQPYYYGDSYYNGNDWNGATIAPTSTYYLPLMPRGDGTYPYNGSPQGPPPLPETNPTPTLPSKNRFVSVFPAYGEQPQPITTATVPAPSVSYPAYGEQPSTPATVVSNNNR